MKNVKILLFIFVFLISLYSVNSIDSFSCLPTDVIEGGTQSCEVDLSSGSSERNKAYNITWYNTTSQVIAITGCSFTGTTADQNNPPNIVQVCTIPADWGATTDGVVNFSIDGVDSILFNFNISKETSIDLIINEIIIETPCYLGEFCGIRGTVSDATSGKPVIGAECTGDILQLQGGNLVPIAVQGAKTGFQNVKSKYAGHFMISPLLTHEAVIEGESYIIEFRCDCKAGQDSCALDNGTLITDATSTVILNKTLRGIGTTTLDVSTWLTTSTSTLLSTMRLKQLNTVSVNVTNNRIDIRVPLEIIYACRINADDDSSLRRIKSPIYFPECDSFGECIQERGVDADTIQQQSIDFIAIEHPFLQGRTTKVYCSADVRVRDIIEERVTYSTNSLVFNITSDEINIPADWQWISDLKINSIVNMSDSKYDDYNGTGTGNIDIQLSIGLGKLELQNSLNIFNIIKNITISNSTSDLIEHVDYEIEWLKDNHVEIEIRSVPLDKADGLVWYNTTIEFYDLKLRDTIASENQSESLTRSAIALENISDKTGTFHLSVDCPSFAEKGKDIECTIIAFIEDDQLVQKEVDFTCYIDKRGQSELNFNQMITRTPQSFTRKFNVPKSFADGTTHNLVCEAGYYNLGSRTDKFSDSFIASKESGNRIANILKTFGKLPGKAKEIIKDSSIITIIILVSCILLLGLLVYRRKVVLSYLQSKFIK